MASCCIIITVLTLNIFLGLEQDKDADLEAEVVEADYNTLRLILQLGHHHGLR